MKAICWERRIELRVLGTAPGLVLAAVYALELGIASATAKRNVFRRSLSNPVSFPVGDRLVRVFCRACGRQFDRAILSASRAAQW
jgi:hypothetical protein